jgi:hypothetical protein
MLVIDQLRDFFIHILFFNFWIQHFLKFWNADLQEESDDKSDEDEDEDAGEDDDGDDKNEDQKREEKKEEIRYEDKYMENFHKMTTLELSNERKDQLENNVLFENTPLGLVIMFYSQKKECFVFYSDYTIPYRYLETIGRKYVLTYKCKSLFVDMEEELKIAKEKLEMQEKQENENMKHNNQGKWEGQNQEQRQSEPSTSTSKKNVFAKFKNYNKEASKQVVKNQGTNSKNSITNSITSNNGSNSSNSSNSSKTTMLLKENANKYSYGGRISNFNILKKVDKKLVDKRLKMTFSEFKKLQQQNQ